MPGRRACFTVTTAIPSIAILMLAFSAYLCADEVLLSSGGRVQGDVVSQDDNQLVMQTAYGRVTFQTADITRVVYATPLEKQIRLQLESFSSSDISGRLKLASTAATAGLKDLAGSIYTQVIAIDPDEKEARRALGYVLYEDEWVTPREKDTHPGLVPYRGQWVRPAERDSLRQNDAQRAYFKRFGLSQAQGEALVNTISDIGLEIEPRGGYVVRRHIKTWPVKDKSYFYSTDILNWQRLGVFVSVTFIDSTRHRVRGFGTLSYSIYAVNMDALGNAQIGKEMHSETVDITTEMYERQSDFTYWDTKVNSTYEPLASDSAREAWSENYYFNSGNVLYVMTNRSIDLLTPPGAYYVEATFTLGGTVKKAGRFVQYAELR